MNQYRISRRRFLRQSALGTALGASTMCAGPGVAHAAPAKFRGLYFNPQVCKNPSLPFLFCYPECRETVRSILRELPVLTGVNLLDVFVAIAYSLKNPSQAPQPGEPLSAWANTAYLDNVATFIDDCHDCGIAVEIDLASNLWIPYSADPQHQIGNSKYWPKPSETPWKESAFWYCETIQYIEQKAKHPENIALWSMMGNHALGTAEPCLWGDDANPAILAGTEQCVKYVWPRFRAAGQRPKAPPFVFPIFANAGAWRGKAPEARLRGVRNLKRWIVDELAMPPDYWPMTTYPFCDPAPDGAYYLRQIVEILGKENAGKIISTDFKAIGIGFADEIITAGGRPSQEMLQWHFKQCADYGFAGWWIWAYQDTAQDRTGIRTLEGAWKPELVKALADQAARSNL